MSMIEPAPYRPLPEEPRGAGSRVLSAFLGVLLICLGALIAIAIGVFTGVVTPSDIQTLVAATRPSSAASVTQQRPAAAPVAAPAASQATTPAQAQPAAAQSTPSTARVVKEQTFGDWRYVCVEAVPGATPNCSIMQQLKLADTDSVVFVWRIAQDGRGGLVGAWQVFAPVPLAAGLTLDAGTPQPLVMPYESCGNGSCQVTGNLTPDFIRAISAASTLSASVVLENRQSLKFPLSGNGLSAALAALSK